MADGLRIADCGFRADLRRDAPSRLPCPIRGRQIVQNWGMARQRGDNYAKRTQSADPGPGGYGPGDPTGGAFSRANCAKQTQFAFERNEGQVLWGKGVMVNCTYKGPWKNKANFRRMGRTWGTRGRAPNKANCRQCGRESHQRSCRSGELCQTNPICLRRAGRPSSRLPAHCGSGQASGDATRQEDNRKQPICIGRVKCQAVAGASAWGWSQVARASCVRAKSLCDSRPEALVRRARQDACHRAIPPLA
jgi:hypothetical protein